MELALLQLQSGASRHFGSLLVVGCWSLVACITWPPRVATLHARSSTKSTAIPCKRSFAVEQRPALSRLQLPVADGKSEQWHICTSLMCQISALVARPLLPPDKGGLPIVATLLEGSARLWQLRRLPPLLHGAAYQEPRQPAAPEHSLCQWTGGRMYEARQSPNPRGTILRPSESIRCPPASPFRAAACVSASCQVGVHARVELSRVPLLASHACVPHAQVPVPPQAWRLIWQRRFGM